MRSRSFFRLKMLALAGAMTAVAGTAQAECRLSIQPAQDQWLVSFDPFAQDAAQKAFDVSLVNQGTAPCEGRVEVNLRGEAYGLSKTGQAQRIPYALIDERSGVDVTPRAGKSARLLNARPISLAPGERELVRFTFAAAPDELLSAGTYAQDALVSVTSADGRSLAERPIALAIDVISAAVMGLKGEFQRSGGVARINLGELSEGARPLNTSLFVWSTAGYSVSVSSANAGELRRDGGDWSVPYGLNVGDRAINLSGAGQISRPSNGFQFDDYPLTIDIGETAGKRAGDYSDVLTFTISAM